MEVARTSCLKETVDEIIARYDGERGQLVSILQDIQEVYRYLPREALERVSLQLDIPMAQVYAVATFFKAFSLEPKGKHILQVCMGTACHVRGAPLLLDEFGRRLGVEPGRTTEDKEFTLESVNCVGACALGPVVVVDDEVVGHVSTQKVADLIRKAKEDVGESSTSDKEP